jgi:O-antigen/teichoic acid export membrane protein
MLRRAIHAANAIVCGHTLVRLGSLVLVPLFLRYWTATQYGEYVALFAAVTYLTGLDIGMQQATVNRLTQVYARNSLEEYRHIQRTALVFYVVLATGITLLVAGLGWFLPWSRWLGLRLTKPSVATGTVILLVAYVMWSMPMRLIVATYQTTGNLARSQWIANVQQALVVVLSALVLLLGGGMLAIASLQLTTVALTTTHVLLDVHRRFPALFPGVFGAKFSSLKELVQPSLLFALLLVGNLVAYQGSVVLTSAIMGGLAVAVLSISKAVIDVVRQALYSIGLALSPDFARMEALGEYEKLRDTHRRVVVGTSIITLAFVGAVWYEGAEIITTWTRGRIEPDVTLLRLFLVLLAFQTPWAASSTVATATNRHQTQAIGYFFAALLGIGLVAAFLRPLGAWAVPVGLTLGEAICCYHFVIKASCRVIGEPYRAFATRFWMGFPVVGASALAAGWAIHSFLPGPMLLRLSASGFFALAVAAASAWMVWLIPADRALLWPKFFARLNLREAPEGIGWDGNDQTCVAPALLPVLASSKKDTLAQARVPVPHGPASEYSPNEPSRATPVV